jgi:hypothetical protein
MNKKQLELLNSDLKRSVYFYVNTKNPTFDKCEMLQNIFKNKHRFDFVDYELIKSNNLPPLEKAEYLLMYSNQIQRSLGF